MTKLSSCHLLDMLAEVPDPRKKKGCRHPLVAMLALTVVGLLCGQRSYTAIAKWARLHPDLRTALGFTAKQIPAASMFYYLFRRLDVTAVEKTLTHSTTQTLEKMGTFTSRLTGVAIDGKTLSAFRRSFNCLRALRRCVLIVPSERFKRLAIALMGISWW